MTAARMFFIISLFFAVAGFAQQPNPYNGTWRVEFASQKDVVREGEVVIKDEAGSWQVLRHKKGNPCAGREAPVSIQLATEVGLVFAVNASKVITGCKDQVVTLKRVDDRTLQGTMDDGREITMVRQ